MPCTSIVARAELRHRFRRDDTMGMPAPLQRWTRERVLALPHDGRRHELVGGELLVTPAPRVLHELVVRALYDRIAPFVRAHGLGIAMSGPADYAFGADEVLQPDLFVVPRGFSPLAAWTDLPRPLLVVEVTSPASADADRGVKRRRYLEAGIPEYWVVDPDRRHVERFRPGAARAEVVTATLAWQPRGESPRLEMDLVEVFAEVWEGSR